MFGHRMGSQRMVTAPILPELCLDKALRNRVGFLGCFGQGQGLRSMIPGAPLQLRIFHDTDSKEETSQLSFCCWELLGSPSTSTRSYLLLRKTRAVMPDCPSSLLLRRVPSMASQTWGRRGHCGDTGHRGVWDPEQLPVLCSAPELSEQGTAPWAV